MARTPGLPKSFDWFIDGPQPMKWRDVATMVLAVVVPPAVAVWFFGVAGMGAFAASMPAHRGAKPRRATPASRRGSQLLDVVTIPNVSPKRWAPSTAPSSRPTTGAPSETSRSAAVTGWSLKHATTTPSTSPRRSRKHSSVPGALRSSS